MVVKNIGKAARPTQPAETFTGATGVALYYRP